MFNRLVDNERLSIRTGLISTARTLANLVDNEIDTHVAIVSLLAQSKALQDGDLTAFWREAKKALEIVPGAWLAVSQPDGQMELNTLAAPGSTLPRHLSPETVRKGFLERRPQFADLVFGPVAQQWTAYIELPVFKEDAPLYSLSIAVSPKRFLSLLSENFRSGEVVAIVDRSKKFVARIPDHDARVGTLASEGWRAAMSADPDGWTENRTVEGDLSITGYATTSRGWTAGIAQLESKVARPQTNIFWTTVFLTGALVTLSILFALWLSRRAGKGMSALAEAAHNLRDGKAIEPPPAPFLEAATIGQALADVSIELKRRGEIISTHRTELVMQVATRTAELVAEIKLRSETETTLRQVQKMEAIGQLTGGIAHDFNNMLAIVIGSLDLAKRRLSGTEQEKILKLIENAYDGAQRAAVLTGRLLAFSRQQALDPRPLDCNKLVAGMSELLRRTLGENIQIESVLAGGLWRTHADAAQVESAVINLSVNARDSMPDGGKLTIETANTHLDERYASTHEDVKAGQYVVICVTDTGVGMSPEIADRAFDPFYTTKGIGKGTGLGLSQVFGFVKQSHGHVKIYSEVAKGTTVKIYLPRYFGHEEVGSVVASHNAIEQGSPDEVILVVEDEAQVRHIAVDFLREIGYTVIQAASPLEALQQLAIQPVVTLLFTDVVMPEMNGRQLAERARQIIPGIRVLYATGYTRNAIVHNGTLDVDTIVVFKPFTIDQLATKIRQAIDTPSGAKGR